MSKYFDLEKQAFFGGLAGFSRALARGVAPSATKGIRMPGSAQSIMAGLKGSRGAARPGVKMPGSAQSTMAGINASKASRASGATGGKYMGKGLNAEHADKVLQARKAQQAKTIRDAMPEAQFSHRMTAPIINKGKDAINAATQGAKNMAADAAKAVGRGTKNFAKDTAKSKGFWVGGVLGSPFGPGGAAAGAAIGRGMGTQAFRTGAKYTAYGTGGLYAMNKIFD